MPEVRASQATHHRRRDLPRGRPGRGAPLRRAAILAVIHNPFAGRYVEEIAGFMDDLKPLGLDMAQALVAALGGDPKADRRLRQRRHRRRGGRTRARRALACARRLRDARGAGGAKAIVPRPRKSAGPGTRLDVPITHINASYVRSHFDAIEVGIADAPARRRNGAGPRHDHRARGCTRASAA